VASGGAPAGGVPADGVPAGAVVAVNSTSSRGADLAPASRLARGIACRDLVTSAKLTVPLPRTAGVTSIATRLPALNGPLAPILGPSLGARRYVIRR
jgi:hypothetical protein